MVTFQIYVTNNKLANCRHLGSAHLTSIVKHISQIIVVGSRHRGPSDQSSSGRTLLWLEWDLLYCHPRCRMGRPTYTDYLRRPVFCCCWPTRMELFANRTKTVWQSKTV